LTDAIGALEYPLLCFLWPKKAKFLLFEPLNSLKITLGEWKHLSDVILYLSDGIQALEDTLFRFFTLKISKEIEFLSV
jgi:hypothetical protein